MKSILYITTLALVLLSSSAIADCTQGGRSFGEGEKVGPYTCQGGKWVRE
jgi:hypothetical protein